MTERRLYVAAYDIADALRLHESLLLLKRYASGGQRSVFECFLSERERRELIGAMHGVMAADEDRFLLLPLRASGDGVRALGAAVAASDPDFFYVG